MPKPHSACVRLLAALVATCSLLSAASTARAADDAMFEAHYTTAFPTAQEQSAGNLLNFDRARYDLPTLALDAALCRIARLKSEDMRDNGYFAHTSPTYGDVRSMLTQMGYPFAIAVENIAHHATIEKAQAALLSSPSHRRNMLSAAYTRLGVGIALDAKGYVYLTQIFVR